jgi:hypothetical protein
MALTGITKIRELNIISGAAIGAIINHKTGGMSGALLTIKRHKIEATPA